MIEHKRQAPERPAAERYYVRYAALGVDAGGVSLGAALQEAINEGARQSWKLISGTKDPAARAQSWCGTPPGSSPASYFDRKICAY